MTDNENTYQDPPNIQDVVSKLESEDFVSEQYLHDLVNDTFPGWVIAMLDRYSVDYPHLQSNWDVLTSKYNIAMGKIIIVDKFIVDEDHKLVQIFAELYTRLGYVMRAKKEMGFCAVCKSAIPAQDFHERMKCASMPVPDVWSSNCSTCSLV